MITLNYYKINIAIKYDEYRIDMIMFLSLETQGLEKNSMQTKTDKPKIAHAL